MNEKIYRQAMENFTPAPILRERTARAVEEAGTHRPRTRPLRAALLAACLCLALVGTAFAATAVYRLAVRPDEEEHWGDAFTGYHIYGRPIAHALEEFTQEFQDDFAAWDHPSILFNQKFDTWEQAKAYLGDSIPLVWHSMDGVIFTNEYRVSAKYEMYGDGKITYVNIYNAAKLSNGLTYTTDAYIYTPDYSGDILSGRGWPLDWDNFQAEILDSYPMANGCVAEVVMQSVDYEEGAAHDLIGSFMKDGVLYEVDLYGHIQSPLDEAGLETLLHQILDSFE